MGQNQLAADTVLIALLKEVKLVSDDTFIHEVSHD